MMTCDNDAQSQDLAPADPRGLRQTIVAIIPPAASSYRLFAGINI
jgi:hypothetical protein